MITQLSRKYDRSIIQSQFVLITMLIVASAVASTDDEFIPTSPVIMLAMDKYYNIENLADAAAAMRMDAYRFSLNVEEHPQADKAVNRPARLHLHVAEINPDISDRSYLSVLASVSAQTDTTDDHVAILAVNRVLSIDEVAGLFESGIRILERLPSGPHNEFLSGYIVQGSAAALVALEPHDYFLWLGEYSADLKRRADLVSSSLDQYRIYLFKNQIKQSYLADLESLGAIVKRQSEQYRSIKVKCSWETAMKLCDLDWVRSIQSVEFDVSDTVRPSDSLSDNGSKIQHVTALAQNSRILAGSEGPGNGAGVNVGVVDAALAFQSNIWGVTHTSLVGHNHYLMNAEILPDDVYHGTMVTSLILGNVMNLLCINGKPEIVKGISPQSMFSFMSNRNELEAYERLYILNEQATQVSNHSYHNPVDTFQYNGVTEQVDLAAFEMDAVIVASNGTWTPEGTRPTSPGLGKNVLAVGAINYVDCYSNTYPDERVGNIALYSNSGATLYEGRLKPDLVAPGGSIFRGTDENPEYGVVAARTAGYGPETMPWCDNSYAAFIGCSVATPLVTGGIAKVMGELPGPDYVDGVPKYRSELIRALMINSAIPLKGNAPQFIDNAADAMHRGYCNTTYGYGLSNPVSAVYYGEENSGPDNSFTRFVFQRSVDVTREATGSFDLSVGRTPVRVVATMVYNDTPGSVLNNDLDLTLVLPSLVAVTPGLAPGVSSESPVEKIIIESEAEGDLLGTWNWSVAFPYSDSANPNMDFTLVVDAYYAKPMLRIVLDPQFIGTKQVGYGDEVYVTGQVINIGGGVVAGASLRVKSDGLHDTIDDVEFPIFLGNLYGGITGKESKSFAIKVTMPRNAGYYNFNIEANAANLEFLDAPYAASVRFQVMDVVPDDKGSWDEPMTLGRAPRYNPTNNSVLCSDAEGCFYVAYAGDNSGYNIDTMMLQKFDSAKNPLFGYGPGVEVASHNARNWYQKIFWDSDADLVLLSLNQQSDVNSPPGIIQMARIAPENGQQISPFMPLHNPPRKSQATLPNSLDFYAQWAGNGAMLLVYNNYTTSLFNPEALYIERIEVVDTDEYDSSWEIRIPNVYPQSLAALFDEAGGVYICYRLNSDPSESRRIQYYAADGMSSWSHTIDVTSSVSNNTRLVAGPRGGCYFCDGSNLHLITRNGRREWGVTGRPWNADWIKLIDSDGHGGILVEKQSYEASYAVMRVGPDLEEIWSDPAVVIPSNWTLGSEEVAIGDRNGGLMYSNQVTDIASGMKFAAFVSVDGDGEYRPDMNRYVSMADPDDPRRMRGMLDGHDGSVWGYYTQNIGGEDVTDQQVMRIGDTEGREHFPVFGEVVNSGGVPMPGQTVKILNGDSGVVLFTTTTNESGSYGFPAVPGFSDIRVVVDASYPSSPDAYTVEVLKHDLEASFIVEAPAFENVTNTLLQGYNRVTNAADWVDIDGDGDDDLFLSYGQAEGEPSYMHLMENKLVEKNQSGNYADITPSNDWDGLAWNGPTISTAWADFDNDGDQDFYMVNGIETAPESKNLLYWNNGDPGSVTLEPYPWGDASVLEDQNAGGRAEWVDIDNDGDLDLIVGRPNRAPLAVRNWCANGGNIFSSGAISGLSNQLDSGFMSWCDYNNDGLVDAFVFGVNDSNRLMKNNGDWTFTDVTGVLGLSTVVDGAGKAAAWGDYDNDGDLDLFVGFNAGPYINKLLRNDGSQFTDVTFECGLPTIVNHTQAAAWVDIDNDGDLDLIVAGQPVVVWTNEYPDAEFVILPGYYAPADAEPRTISLTDYDSDGDEDLFIGIHSHAVSTVLSRLHENTLGDQANWIKVDLHGVIMNRDGVGARLMVYTDDGVVQTRQLTGYLGGNSHNSYTQIFGLGSHEKASKVRIEWPWGRITEIPNVYTGQTVELTDEFPTPQGGELFITSNANGTPAEFPSSVPVGSIFNLYLAVDLTGSVIPGSRIGTIECRVQISTNLTIVSEEIMSDGIDLDPDSASYLLTYDTGLPAGSGPVPLVKLRVVVNAEGADPQVWVNNIEEPSFQDPLVNSVPSWTDYESGIRYRLEDPLLAPRYRVLLNDTRAPQLSYSGLFMNNRAWVLVQFDEPIEGVGTDGMDMTDPCHYLVYNVEHPSTVKTIIAVISLDPKSYLLFLGSAIGVDKYFNVTISDAQDLHANHAGDITGVVTYQDPNELPPIMINEAMPEGGNKASSETSITWIEVIHEGDRAVCLNGWSLDCGNGNRIVLPESPILVLQPDELALILASDIPGMIPESNAIVYQYDGDERLIGNYVQLIEPFGQVVDQLDFQNKSGENLYPGVSLQRFIDTNTSVVYWVADGPEFAQGLHGTPGWPNKTESGFIENPEIPALFKTGLLSAVPNPFNPQVTISLAIRETGNISVDIYNIRGRWIRCLLDKHCEATARMDLLWDGRDSNGDRIASGMYLVKMRADQLDIPAMKILLLK